MFETETIKESTTTYQVLSSHDGPMLLVCDSTARFWYGPVAGPLKNVRFGETL